MTIYKGPASAAMTARVVAFPCFFLPSLTIILVSVREKLCCLGFVHQKMLRFVGAPLVRQASALAFQQRSFVRPLMGGAFSSSALTFPHSGGLQL